jgi:hypothetical protein
MTLEQARKWRTLAGKAVALFIILIFATLFEGLVAQFRQPFNEYEVIPGNIVDINGPLAEDIQTVQELAYTSDSDYLQVTFTEIHRGFWLGGNMWRGKLEVSPLASAGTYNLAVMPKHLVSDKPPLRFRIVVHPDLLSLQQNSRSFIQRQTGVSPWGVVGLFLGLTALAVVVLLFLAGKIEKLMAHSGQAEIYKVEKLEGGYAIAFGLGTEHGVRVDDAVTILDAAGNQVGTAEVQQAAAKDSVGLANIDQDIRPGYIVSLNR